MSDYDCVVIGSGPGGYVAAIRAAQLGLSTACVEKDEAPGGTCLNRGCIPTKTLLAASDLMAELSRAEVMGVTAADAKLDMRVLQARKQKIVKALQAGVAGLLKKNKVTHVTGFARLADRHTVKIVSQGNETTVLKAANVIIATGSAPARPAMFPFGKRVMTSDEILEIEELPQSVLVIGGGIIGSEFACFFSDAGCDVTVVEMLDRLVSVLDEDVSKELLRTFKKRKMGLHLSTRIEKLEVSDEGVRAHMSDGKTVDAEMALVAVGRTLVTREMGLEEAGIEVDDKGAIRTDDHLRTTVSNVYAVGDVNGRWQLAHAASHQGIIAAENIAGRERRWSDRVVPSCVYTHPEIGTLGLTEAAAKERYSEISTRKYPFASLGRAMAANASDGFVKLVSAGKKKEIVGIHIVGARATDLITQGVLGMELQVTARELAEAVYPHPTFSEAIMECAAALLGEGIHS